MRIDSLLQGTVGDPPDGSWLPGSPTPPDGMGPVSPKPNNPRPVSPPDGAPEEPAADNKSNYEDGSKKAPEAPKPVQKWQPLFDYCDEPVI